MDKSKISSWIGTVNEGSIQYAQDEMRRLFPGTTFLELQGNEVMLMSIPSEMEGVYESMITMEPIFLRHLQPVNKVLSIEGALDKDLTGMQAFIKDHSQIIMGKKTAVQFRKSNLQTLSYTPGEMKAAVDPLLMGLDAEPVIQEPQIIVSLFAARNQLYCGISTPAQNFSDWSGGAIRFQREQGQISRAKFKLLEAEVRFGINMQTWKEVLDIGAAPGGWTSLLLERGAKVTAIDPAELDLSLKGHPNVTIIRKNAAEVKLRYQQFDALVCDMSWSPRQMSKLVGDLLYALRLGGAAVITVKLMYGKPFQTLKEVLKIWEGKLDLLYAKQLFHNRDELTLYLKRSYIL